MKGPSAPVEARQELVRAGKSLEAAKALLGADLLEDALSRAYYAVLHAARALLVSEGHAPDSHEATKRLFGLHVVKPGKVDAEFGRILREQQDDRALADYDVAFVPAADRVAKRVADAERFLAEARRVLLGV